MDGKFFQKIFQKSSKMDPRWRQNGQKIDPKRHPKNDRSQEQPQGAPYRIISHRGWASWGVLGASWGVLGGKSGQHGSNLAPKMEPRWSKNPSKFGSFFGCLLGSIFDRFLIDFCFQNGGKLRPKSIKNRCQLRKAIF